MPISLASSLLSLNNTKNQALSKKFTCKSIRFLPSGISCTFRYASVHVPRVLSRLILIFVSISEALMQTALAAAESGKSDVSAEVIQNAKPIANLEKIRADAY